MNATDISQAATREGIADYRFTRMLGTGNHGAFYLAPPPGAAAGQRGTGGR